MVADRPEKPRVIKVLGGQRGPKRHPQFVLHARNAAENSGGFPRGFPLAQPRRFPSMGRFEDDRIVEAGSWRFWNIPGRRRTWRPELVRFAVAPVAIAIVWAISVALAPVLYGALSYLLFFAAVLVAAGVGGLGPGLLATVLGAALSLVARRSNSAIT